MKLDLKLYRGYVNDGHLVVFGHVFKSWAPDKYRLDRRGLRHAFSIIHMFRIKPMCNFVVVLQVGNLNVSTRTLDDGYFRFDIPFNEPLPSGWHEYTVSCKLMDIGIVERGEFLKPFKSKVAIISDIDDTFLISYSNRLFKKLFVMLSQNINKRKIFKDVVRHYQRLSAGGQSKDASFNSFFYVSSSEWNLYGFINDFATIHDLPKAVIKLKDIKTGIRDFLSTGRGNHDHKFHKIKDIISFYPDLKYVLLGDDSQHDPKIYERIIKIFPASVKAVYIRQTGKTEKKHINAIMTNMESMGVNTCYFSGSEKAIAHSERIGII